MISRRAVLALAAFAAAAPLAAQAADPLPDLKGRKVVVVTENAYPPLQFVDPKSGKQIGWEYDAMNEIAKRLNFKVEYQNTSWDAMIQSVSDKQYDIGMTGITIKDERKEKVDFSDPYMRSEQFMLVRGDEKRFTDAKSFAADTKLLVALSRARRPSTPPSTACWTATRRTRASSCSKPSAPPFRPSRPRRRHRSDRWHGRQGLCGRFQWRPEARRRPARHRGFRLHLPQGSDLVKRSTPRLPR